MGRVINYTTDASDEDYVVLLNLFIVHLKCYCVFSSLHSDVMSWLIAAKCIQLTVDRETMSVIIKLSAYKTVFVQFILFWSELIC